MIHPLPQRTESYELEYSVPESVLISPSGDERDFIKGWCDAFGYSTSQQGNVLLASRLSPEIKAPEGYCLRVTHEGDKLSFSIEYGSKKGLWHGLCSVGRVLRSGSSRLKLLEDYPLFKKRGFIEGFYGTPWSEEGRYEIMKLMSSCHMNTYYYAPKDDLFHREKWDSLYDAPSLAKLKRVVEDANTLQLELHYCIAPGLTVEYSSESQLHILFEKLFQVYSLGVRRFGLLLDDIARGFQFDSDKKAFSELEDAHIYYVNRVYRRLKALDSDIEMSFCPTVYHGKGTEHYISKVGKALPPDINIFYTGYNICSQELTVQEAKRFMASTDHKPLYWDNFPVNDAEMFNEMHICPILGREPDLYKHSQGLIANCMEYVEANKFSLYTIADFLWNPQGYSKEESFKSGVEELLGVGTYDSFRFFTDSLRASCLKDDNSALMDGYLYETAFRLRRNRKQEAVELFSEYLSKMEASVRVLYKDENEKLRKELTHWLDKYELCCELLRACLLYMREPREVNRESLRARLKEYNFHPARYSDFCLQEFADFLLKG